MSSVMSASSSPKRNSARDLASSVLPTPVGPAKMNDPEGRFGSFRPARVRRMARDRDLIASSWPITRRWSSSSMLRRRSVSSSVSLNTGMPVDLESTSAMRSSSTVATSASAPVRHACSFSRRSSSSCCSWSRRRAAPSKSWPSMAASFWVRTSAIRDS